MSSQSFLLKLPANSILFQRLLEEDSEFSLVQSGEQGMVYSAELTPLIELTFGLSPGEFEIETLEEEGWRDSWALDLAPVEIKSLNLSILPQLTEDSLEQVCSDNQIGLFPGRSFGIGHHETTKIILELMGRNQNLFKGKTVLDFGCGSGILGIIASKLGAQSILSVDIDEEALRVTEINARLNLIKNLTTSKSLQGSFNILLINTLKSVIETEFLKISPYLSSGAIIFASGYLIKQQEDVARLLSIEERDFERGEEWGAILGTANN